MKVQRTFHLLTHSRPKTNIGSIKIDTTPQCPYTNLELTVIHCIQRPSTYASTCARLEYKVHRYINKGIPATDSERLTHSPFIRRPSVDGDDCISIEKSTVHSTEK